MVEREREKMEEIVEERKPHVLVLPFPTQGHINPMLQFSNRLVSKGVRVSFAITNYQYNTLRPPFGTDVNLVIVADGYGDGGFESADTFETYLANFKELGTISLSDLIEGRADGPHPFTCIVYDSFLPWGLDLARNYDIAGGPFFTQACAASYMFSSIYNGELSIPVSSDRPIEISGLPSLDVGDLPLFVGLPESYPANFDLHVNQSINLDKADFVLGNSYYELEDKVVEAMSRECPLLTIGPGPTVPSLYLDNTTEEKPYGIQLYNLDNPTGTTDWLSTKPPKSVVYVSFGSLTSLPNTQMEELAWGLNESGFDILWVVPASEEDKLPLHFVEEVGEKVLFVKWCEQLEVLANEAVGCFLTHCGWNSTLEALGLGVPMIGMPQWTDQPTNAKLIQDVWNVGVRVEADEEGTVAREEIAGRIREVMGGERSEKIRENTNKWKDLIKEAVSHGGSSDRNIDEFVSTIERLVMGVPQVDGLPKWTAYSLLHGS